MIKIIAEKNKETIISFASLGMSLTPLQISTLRREFNERFDRGVIDMWCIDIDGDRFGRRAGTKPSPDTVAPPIRNGKEDI